MKQLKLTLVLYITSALWQPIYSQFTFNPEFQDSSINNLVHPSGYKTCIIGELGEVKKYGSKNESIILIPGWGFDASVYDNFIEEYQDRYTIYAITPAGFGGTPAPPIPDTSSRFSELTWTKGIVTGVINLIKEEKLEKPIVIGHFLTGSAAALDIALNYPDKVSKVIIISGIPYNYYQAWNDTLWENEQKLTADQIERFTKSMANNWYKTVTKETWDRGNYRPEEYSSDSIVGKILFDHSAKVPLNVMVRYLLESIAFDISPEVERFKIPVLILIPSFSEEFFQSTYTSLNQTMKREWIKYRFQEVWNSSKNRNPLLKFKIIPDSRYFIWYDNPDEVYKNINLFLKDNYDTTPRVTGIGGVFFLSDNPISTTKWYEDNLGLVMDEYGSAFEFRNANRPDEINYLRWSIGNEKEYFAPSTKGFMINYRVQNIEGLVDNLIKKGNTVLDSIKSFPYGKFVHILDPEGNKIELWEPIDSVLTEMGGKTTK